MNVTATPKFFKRSLPKEEVMELRGMAGLVGDMKGKVLIFLRENGDSENPSRIRIQLTPADARSFADCLIEFADKAVSK